ncbi:MAG: sugar phosphate nucleotidyltransferase [Candidatus Aenigmarchaeota archaeon]|nr:sugar phosphate nucleotidyltransferase [Candidatus Aenigmarchaeota archaeon]MDI6722118.1 sugar phosphate nucleotidyltransferase [Candidatus Aenigmarchaeota archaeon]
MDVVILCGGRGTRLAEKTSVTPKPLVPIGDRPILWHIMKIYSHHGYKRFVLPLGYKGHEIKRFFMEYPWVSNSFEINMHSLSIPKPKEDWSVALVDTGIDSKTQKRLFFVKDHIKSSRFMLTYGDGVANINISDLVKRHNYLRQIYGVLGTVTLHNPKSKFGIVDIEKDLAKEFREKPDSDKFINIGFMVFEKEVFDYIDDSDVMLESSLLTSLAKEGKIGVYHHENFWGCMDTYGDYLRLNELWNKERPWKIWQD